MANKPIEAGAQITDEMLATRIVPRAYVEDRAVLESERAKVIGLRIGHTVQSQQTLMWTDLAIAMEKGRNLSSLIQPGMRAVTVRTKGNDDKSFALIRPGDRIDVIATMPARSRPISAPPSSSCKTCSSSPSGTTPAATRATSRAPSSPTTSSSA